MMTPDQLAAWLDRERALLLERLEAELEIRPEAAALPRREHVRLFEALRTALAGGDYAPLENLMVAWVSSQADVALQYRAPLLPIITAFKATLWDVMPQRMTEVEALGNLKVLDPLLTHAVVRLTDLTAQSDQSRLTEELQATKRHLERLDRTKSDFISIAAHELKTPLTLIEGYASMLGGELGARMDPRQEMLLAGIRNGAKRLGEIVQDMIDVSMIDTAVLTLRFQPVRFRRLVEMVIHDWEASFAERQVVLALGDFDDGGQVTYADPERMTQVISNILGNGLKYTPDGGRVTVSARTLPGQDALGRAGFVEMMIADNGIGIDVDDQERIFQKFERVGSVALHSSGKTKFKGGGPGLGLAIAKGVVEAHGGSLWVESAGHDESAYPGSTFHLLLPLYYDPPEDKSGRLLGMGSETGRLGKLMRSTA
jgi:signal transduction histidine kinase